MTTESVKKRRYIAISILAAMIAVSVAGSVFLVWNWEYVEELSGQGYLGLFIIAIFAGSPLPIPTPSMILTFTLGSLLNPAIVGLVSGVGNGIGNAFVLLAGRGGFLFFQNLGISALNGEDSSSRWGRFLQKIRMPRILNFATSRGGLVTVFFLCMYPNPFLMPILLGIGATRSHFLKFFLASLAGRIVEAMVLAYLGYFGLGSLLRFIGIFNVNVP